MKDPEWLSLDDEALERLLVDRWRYRGVMLAVMLVAAIVAAYVWSRGITSVVDHVTVGALMTLAFISGVAAFVMRLSDLRMYSEIRRRRSERPR